MNIFRALSRDVRVVGAIVCIGAIASVGVGWLSVRLGTAGLSNAGVPLLVAAFFAVGIPVVVRYARRREAFSLLPLISVFYMLVFAVGAVYYRYPGHAHGSSALVGFETSYTNTGLVRALALAFLSYVIFACSFMGARFMRVCGRVAQPRRIRSDHLVATAAILAVIGWVARAAVIHLGIYFRYSGTGSLPTRGQFATVISVAAYLPLMAFALVAIEHSRRGAYRLAFWIMLAAECAWALPSGERARIIGLALLLIVVRYYTGARGLPWKRILSGTAVAIFVVLPFGAYYRGAGGDSGYQRAPVAQLGTAATEMLSSLDSLPRTAFEETFSRFSDIASVATITTQGRQKFPYNAHEEIAVWEQSLIPRFLLPSKVDPGLGGNDFGHAYGIVFRTSQASVSTTYIGDLYGSLGFWGVVVGMAVIGVLARGVDEYLGRRRDNMTALAVYVTMLGPFLLGLETTVVVGFIQTLKSIALYVVAGALPAAVTRGGRAGSYSESLGPA